MTPKTKQKLRVKYNRVSTLQQSGERYKLDEEKYDVTLFDKISGKVPFNERPQAKKLIELVHKGEVAELVLEEISRVGRSTGDCIKTLEWLEEKKINVVVRNLGLQSRPNGKPNPFWKVATSILSSVYELEISSIAERTSMGRQIFIQNGGKLGRPENSKESDKKFLNKPKTQQIIKWLNKGRTIAEIVSHVGCSNKTVIKTKRLGVKYGVV